MKVKILLMILKNIIYKYFKLFYYYNSINVSNIYVTYILYSITLRQKYNNHINKNSKILFNNYFDKLNSTYI